MLKAATFVHSFIILLLDSERLYNLVDYYHRWFIS
jgi:hypothetical protein